MAKLKTNDDVDLFVAPHTHTDGDRAAIRAALAERRKSPGHAAAVAELQQIAKRLKTAQPAAHVRATKKKGKRTAA